MTFMNCFTQFNINNSSGFNDFLTPQNSFMAPMVFTPPMFNFGFNFNAFQPFNFNWNSLLNWNSPMDSWNMPASQFFNSTPTFSWGNLNNTGNFDTFIRSTNRSNGRITISTELKSANLNKYNAQKGKKLAEDALSHSVGWRQHCAKYVSNALERTGLSNGSRGHAYQMINILRNNNNFEEIDANTDVNSLPAGCILVFDKGVQGYNKKYGHIEITSGNGQGISDGITQHLKQPTAIFMPV